MLSITDEALREGCERARDLFLLGRLQGPDAGRETMTAVFEALGLDDAMRGELERTAADILPVEGAPALEAVAAASVLSGVLVGLLVAASALPPDDLDLPVTRARAVPGPRTAPPRNRPPAADPAAPHGEPAARRRTGPGSVQRDLATVRREPVEHEDVDREDRQRPERIRRHEHQLRDRVQRHDRDARPAGQLVTGPDAEADE